MSDWNFEHRAPLTQRPYLFYAAFADQDVINRLEETHVIHAMLEITSMPAAPFRTGKAWEALRHERPELAEKIAEAPLAVTLHGTVLGHENLEYLRDTLRVMTALLGHGACAVYDPLTLTWYGPAEWPGHEDFRPLDHITITHQDGECRTRGLRKFGRPDLLIQDAEHGDARRLLEHAISHLTKGGALPAGEPFLAHDRQAIPGDIKGNSDDAKFHNTHQVLSVTRPG